MQAWVVWFGAAIIGMLLLTALGLHFLLYRQKQRQKQREIDWNRESAEQELASQEQAKDSITIICRALLSGQVDCGEASIRISNLLDRLDMSAEQRADYVVFDKVRSALQHIPIKQDWLALDKKARKTHAKTIARIESEFSDFAKTAAEQILAKKRS